MKLLLQITFLISLSCAAQDHKDFVIHFSPDISYEQIEKEIRQIPQISNIKTFSKQKRHPLHNVVKFQSESFRPKMLDDNLFIETIEELPQTFFATDTLPSDPYFPFQWENDLVNAQLAWNELSNNDTTLLVGIVDSGTDFNHDDLNNVYINPNDPVNGIDDDSNSYIDDIYGWDFGEYDNNPAVTVNSSHGREMTSLVAARTNNNKGISALSYNIKYLTAKITSDAGVLTDPYEGVLYAIDQGVQIINCSWYQNVSTVYSKRIIDYANEKGVLIVAASGNNNSNTPVFPANYPTVLSVGAIKEDLTKTNSSNYGDWVDIFSPGHNIYAAFPGNTFAKTSGTSVACAITTSACSLLKKRFPNETPIQLINRIKRSGTSFKDGNIFGKYLNLYQATQNPEITEFIAYPNPNFGEVFINIPQEYKGEKIEFEIYSIAGKLVFREKHQTLINQEKISFSIKLSSGQYILALKTKNSRKTTILTFAP